MLSGSRELSVGEAVHKAKLEIDEEGTKAAAATAFFTWRIMDEESETPIEFKCDRPFLFVLYNKLMHTVLFTGIYKRPPQRN